MSLHITVAYVAGATVTRVLPPDVFTVTIHVESFSIRKECPLVSVVTTGRTTVCVVVPVKNWVFVEATVRVVVPAAVAVVVNQSI